MTVTLSQNSGMIWKYRGGNNKLEQVFFINFYYEDFSSNGKKSGNVFSFSNGIFHYFVDDRDRS